MEDWTARKPTVSSTCTSQKSPVKSNSPLGPRSPRYADFRVGNQEAQPQTLLDAVAGHGEEGFEGMDKIHIGRGIETQSESCLLGRGPLIQLVEQQRSFQNVKGSEIASLQRQQKKKGKVTQKVPSEPLSQPDLHGSKKEKCEIRTESGRTEEDIARL